MLLGGGGSLISPIVVWIGDERGVPRLDGALLGSRLTVALRLPLIDDLAEDIRGSRSLSSSAIEL